jgi:hypothetical protein
LLAQGETIRQPAVVGIFVQLLLGRARSCLCRRIQPDIVFRVLEIILRGDCITGGMRVTRQLKISFRNVRRRSTDLDVGPVRLVGPILVLRVGRAPIIGRAAPLSVVLIGFHLCFQEFEAQISAAKSSLFFIAARSFDLNAG